MELISYTVTQIDEKNQNISLKIKVKNNAETEELTQTINYGTPVIKDVYHQITTATGEIITQKETIREKVFDFTDKKIFKSQLDMYVNAYVEGLNRELVNAEVPAEIFEMVGLKKTSQE